jgi:Glucose-6-phosphate dehydrogenase, C-terminal domain
MQPAPSCSHSPRCAGDPWKEITYAAPRSKHPRAQAWSAIDSVSLRPQSGRQGLANKSAPAKRTGRCLITDGRLVEPLEPCKSESVFLGEPNVITLRIQPDDGICLQLGVKPPGLTADLSKVAMRFSYEAAFGKSSANGYERLLLEFLGQNTLNIPPLAIHAVSNGEKAVEAPFI